MIELPRNNLMMALETAVQQGHLLIVGEPGAGKTWLLKSFVGRRIALGDAVVFLKAGDYAVSSLHELLESIGVNDFVAALRAYEGKSKLLVIDSLDSLRAEASQRAFRDLIRMVKDEISEVTIVVSIRTFDVQQSIELQHLFPVGGRPVSDSPGIAARHLVVPIFAEAELLEATENNKTLRSLVQSASPEARQLLCNAFNLWIVVRLVETGVEVDWLSSVQSEVQLLDRYWNYRIDSRDDGVARSALLTAITRRLVDSQIMSVTVGDMQNTGLPDTTLKGLLSDEILSRSETARISYTHNILFDFAVSKLLFDERSVMPFVLEAPARGIFYRPSISYFMARLWFRDRSLFWTSTTQFLEKTPRASSVIAITAARAMFELAKSPEDLEPIFGMPSPTRLRAIVFLLRTVNALDGIRSSKRYLWFVFLLVCLSRPDALFLNEATGLLERALADAEATEIVAILANAVVSLLQWIWAKAEQQDISDAQDLANFAAAHLIPLVAKNYDAIPQAAKISLGQALRRLDNPRSSASEAFRLASNLDSVIEDDPEFASEIYVALLGHEESSKETTQIGGAILPLTSTRAQDFSLSHYVLGVKFAQLVARDLHVAAQTAARSVTAQISRKEGDVITSLRAYEWTFSFLGKEIKFNSDRSEIWDRSFKDYTSIQLVDSLLHAISSRRTSGVLSIENARLTLSELGDANTYAVTWRRILTVASYDAELLKIIPDLLQIPELLAAPETTEAAGMAIAKAYKEHLFAGEEFSAIQEAILSIPALQLATIYRDAVIVRNELLSNIPSEELIPAAKEVSAGQQKRKSDANSGLFQVGPAFYGPDEAPWASGRGVEKPSEEERNLLDSVQLLKGFEARFVNEVPPVEECDGIGEKLWAAYQLLLRKTSGAREAIVTDALTTIAAVSQATLKNKELREDSEIVSRCKAIIGAAAVYPLPLPPKEADANFDRPAWSATPKIEAAKGVMHYMGNWGIDERMKLLVGELSSDPSPAVRLQVAVGLIYLYDKNRDLFWKIANERLKAENATGVLVSLAQTVTNPYIAKTELSAVIEWQVALLGRELPASRTDDVLKVLAHSLTDLFVFFGDVRASEALEFFERHPAKYTRELSQIALSSVYYLSYGIADDDPARSKTRSRARDVWKRVLSCADFVISEYFKTPISKESERDQESLKGALSVIDNAVFQVYLLFGVNKTLTRENLPAVNEPQARKLFFELEPIWKLLLRPVSPEHKRLLPAQTTHHLMELFTATVSYNPTRVLELAASLFQRFNMGYQTDQMAIGEIVRFTEVILADHKDALKDPNNASNLASILDQFVEVGWPQATQLIMKLDGAVR